MEQSTGSSGSVKHTRLIMRELCNSQSLQFDLITFRLIDEGFRFPLALEFDASRCGECGQAAPLLCVESAEALERRVLIR